MSFGEYPLPTFTTVISDTVPSDAIVTFTEPPLPSKPLLLIKGSSYTPTEPPSLKLDTTIDPDNWLGVLFNSPKGLNADGLVVYEYSLSLTRI